jgi:hypothetical protein
MAVKTERFTLRIPPEYCVNCIKEALGEIGSFKSFDDLNGYFHGTYTYIFQRVDVNVTLTVNNRETIIEANGVTDDVIGTGGSKAIKKLKEVLYQRAKHFEDFYTLENALKLLYDGDNSGADALISQTKPIAEEAVFLRDVCKAFLMLQSAEQKEGVRILLDSLRNKVDNNRDNFKQLSFIAFKLGYFKVSASILLELKGIHGLDDSTHDFLLLQLILSDETSAFAQEAMIGFPMNIDTLSKVFENKELFAQNENLFDAAFESFNQLFKTRIGLNPALDSVEYLRSIGEWNLPEYYDTHHAYLSSGDIEDFSSFQTAFKNLMEVIRQCEETARKIFLDKYELLFLSVTSSLDQINQIQQSNLSIDGKGVYDDLFEEITSTIHQIYDAKTFTELEEKVKLLKAQNDSLKKLDEEFRGLVSNYINNNIKKFSLVEFNELKTLYRTRLHLDKYSFAYEEALLMESLSKKKKIKIRVIGILIFALLISFTVFKLFSTSDSVASKTHVLQHVTFLESGKEIGIISDHEGFINMRQGPGMTYPVGSKLTTLDSFFILNRDASGWLMIQLADSTKGYIHDSRVDILSEEFYTQILAAFNKESEAIKHIQWLQEEKWITSDLLFIPNYKSLSGVEMYAVYCGKFATESECKEAMRNTKALQSSVYGVLVSNTSPRRVFDLKIENQNFFDGMTDSDIRNYVISQLGKFSSIIENEDIDRFEEIFSSTMSVYHNYRDTPLSTIIINSKNRYFNKWVVLKDSVYNIEPATGGEYEFTYNKVYVIQSKSEPVEKRRYLIEGVLRVDERTGKIIELDDTSTKRME